MTLIHAIILGVVEGVTEFLPISSTAHLILTSRILNLPQTEFQKFFEVFIQSGAILAVIFLYFRYLVKNPKIVFNIIFSFIPTAIVGLLLYRIIKNTFFHSIALIVGAFIAIGILFILIEDLIKNRRINLVKSVNQLEYQQAVLIGVAQSLAVIPGVSRAGAVLVIMLLLGYKRDQAAVYSFLLAVPTIFAAAGLDMIKTNWGTISDKSNLIVLITGFFTAFITAYFSVKWLINYLQKRPLTGFGIYRIIVGIIYWLVS